MSTLEIADVFNQFGHKLKNLTKQESKVVNAIKNCRTSTLGGHRIICKSCDYETQVYNSCRNRHCPKCGFLARAKWIEKRSEDLLDCDYFHAVFTLPSKLREVIKDNKKLMYDLLFKSSAASIKELSKDPKHLGAEVGMIGVLHTWTQDLRDHPHIHYLIPGGGLKEGKWKNCSQNFLLPIKALSKVYRGKIINSLESAYHESKLHFSKGNEYLYHYPNFKELLLRLTDNDFVVYCKKPFAGPKQVIDYLGQYTHKIAIANYRLVKIEDGKVYFKVRDNDNPGQSKFTSLPAVIFMRRFLSHVLPKGFVRIRHFGILGNRSKKIKIALIQSLQGIKKDLTKLVEISWQETLKNLTGIDVDQCPKCLHESLEKGLLIPSILNTG